MIFITVGSQKFQFNRLLQAMDQLVKNGKISEDVFAQTGYSSYVPNNFKSVAFLDRDDFKRMVEASGLIVTHAGTGVIINALKAGKKVIAVPRLVEFGEHVDNHQLEIAKQFAKMRLVESCLDITNLMQAYESVKRNSYRSYASNTELFIDDLRRYLES